MKSLTQYIQEKLIIKKSKSNNYKYFPKTKEELRDIILHRIEVEGNEVNLNDIDVSEVTNMYGLFEYTNFNGDISKWNVSNVTNMNSMFFECKSFNGDISKWNVSNVENMSYMFSGCKSFNQDISTWDVSNVKTMKNMFCNCMSFNQNISQWDVSNVKDISGIFYRCILNKKYKPKFK